MQGTKITVHSIVHVLKNIKNRSHGTIHTFKNYFAIVLSVFNFQFSVSVTISSIQTDPITIIVLFFLTYKAIEVIITNMSALDSFFSFGGQVKSL